MMSPKEFNVEFEKRVDNKFLNFVYELRKGASQEELREIGKLPMEVLKGTFATGARMGIKVWAEIAKEDT